MSANDLIGILRLFCSALVLKCCQLLVEICSSAKRKSNIFGIYTCNVFIWASSNTRLLFAGTSLEITGCNHPQVGLITYMDSYYSWSLKHSPLKVFLLILTYIRHMERKKREKVNKQTRDLGASYNPFCVLEQRRARNTKMITHHLCFDVETQETYSTATHTQVLRWAIHPKARAA